MPAFGTRPPRPGDEPGPRRQHTPEELRVRETFNRADHLAGKTATESAPQAEQAATQGEVFDEPAIRAKLNQLGLDFQIFPIGEKPTESVVANQRLQSRVTELESERAVICNRMLIAEQSAADAIRELNALTVERDTLLKELETLKSETVQEAV